MPTGTFRVSLVHMPATKSYQGQTLDRLEQEGPYGSRYRPGTPTSLNKASYAFADKKEAYESLSRSSNFDCNCRTCETDLLLHSAGSVKTWLAYHNGHDAYPQFYA